MKYIFIVLGALWMVLYGWVQTGLCESRVSTEQGVYQVNVEFETDPVTVGMNALTLKILEEDSGKPVRDSLKIEIVPWMPLHEHGDTHMPEIRALGGGTFHVEGLNFTMPGDWEVYIRMDSGGNEDTAVVDVRVQR